MSVKQPSASVKPEMQSALSFVSVKRDEDKYARLITFNSVIFLKKDEYNLNNCN